MAQRLGRAAIVGLVVIALSGAVPAAPKAAEACCSDCDGDGQVAINELVSGVGHALSGCR